MWDWLFWGSFALGGIAATVGVILLWMSVRAALRTFGELRSAAARSLGELAAKGETTARKAETAGDTAELQESVARLRVSLARLGVLKKALDDVEETAGWVTALL